MSDLRRQTAVFVAGPPGVGKSTVARRVAAALRGAWVDIDATVGPFVQLLAGHGREDVRAAIYASLLETAEASLAAGLHVVVSAPFTEERRDPAAWARVADRVASYGAHPVLVWLHAPREVVVERLAARGAARDADKLADPLAWLRGAEPDAAPRAPHLAVEATGDADATAGKILQALGPRAGADAAPIVVPSRSFR